MNLNQFFLGVATRPRSAEATHSMHAEAPTEDFGEALAAMLDSTQSQVEDRPQSPDASSQTEEFDPEAAPPDDATPLVPSLPVEPAAHIAETAPGGAAEVTEAVPPAPLDPQSTALPKAVPEVATAPTSVHGDGPSPAAAVQTPGVASTPEATPVESTSTSSAPAANNDRFEPLRAAIDRLRPIPAGGATVEVELEGMGRVQVRVEPAGDELRLAVRAEDPATAAAIDRQRTELLDAVRGPEKGDGAQLDLRGGSGRQSSGQPPHDAQTSPPPEPSPAVGPKRPALARAGRGLVDDLA